MSESIKPKTYAAFLSNPQEAYKARTIALYQHNAEEILKPRIYALYDASNENNVSITVDISRKTNTDETVNVDVSRTTSAATNSKSVSESFDLSRAVSKSVSESFDLSRSVSSSIKQHEALSLHRIYLEHLSENTSKKAILSQMHNSVIGYKNDAKIKMSRLYATILAHKSETMHVYRTYATVLFDPEPFDGWLCGSVVPMTYCLKVTCSNGKVLGFTSHDQDITFDGTTYKANTGFTPTNVDTSNEMSSDNLDTTLPLTDDEITVEDLENEVYDFAEFIVYLVNWRDISMGKMILRRGTFGRISYKDREFTTECRGLMEAYQYQAGDTYQKTCRNVFGDEKCGISLSDKTFTGKVVSVSDSSFAGDVKANDGYFDYGVLKWTSGLNIGKSFEVKHSSSDGTVSLFLQPNNKPSLGDTFSITVGCDRNYSTCCSKFSNWKCFRGEPFVPGSDYVIAYGGQYKSNVVSEGQSPKLG